MIRGSIDNLGRVCVRVEAPGDHSLILQIDTALNRKLLVNRYMFPRLGTSNTALDEKSFHEVQLADFSTVPVLKGLVQLIWFDEIILIDALVTTHVPRRPPSDKDPVGLIGTELLADCKLTIDFRKRLVEIER